MIINTHLDILSIHKTLFSRKNNFIHFSALHLTAVGLSERRYHCRSSDGRVGGGGVQAKLAKKQSYAMLSKANQSQAKHCSVAVVLQVEDVAGSVAALLHDASLHHHLHLVLEGVLGHLVLATCRRSSARLRREET